MTIYYRDVIERDDLIINEETLLYLVQNNNTNEFSLKAIKKIHLEKLPFDPYTRAPQYWPIDLKYLFAIENNEEARSKIFYYEHDSQRLILSMGSLTRIEINNLLKIDPISDNEVNTYEERISVTKIYSRNFNSSESNSEEEFIFFMKMGIIFEGKKFFDRLTQLMQSAELFHALCDTAESDERLPLIIKLILIKKECESIKNNIDVLGITICGYNTLYPESGDEARIEFLVRARNLGSVICETIDNVCIKYLATISNYDSEYNSDVAASPQTVETNTLHKEIIELDSNTHQQSNEEEESQTNVRPDNCINTIANRCMAV
jgi:hypothetical protein